MVTNNYEYAPNPTGWVDPLGLTAKPGDCPKLKGTAESAQRIIEDLLESDASGKEISVDVASRQEAEKLLRSMFVGGNGSKYTITTGMNPANAKYSNDVIGQMEGKVGPSKAGTYHWDDQLDPETGRVVGHGTSHGDHPHLQVHHKDGPIIRVNFNWDSDSAWSPHPFKHDSSGYQD